MTNDPFRQIFLAGIGALAIGAEKSQQAIDQLVEKGRLTVEEGKEIASEAAAQTEQNATALRDEIIQAHMKVMTKDQREAFAARVAEMVAQMDGASEASSASETPSSGEKAEASASDAAEANEAAAQGDASDASSTPSH